MVIIRDDPVVSARALAQDLGADLAVGGTEAEAALDRLHVTHADRTDPLEQLGAAMRRAEAVRDRTRFRAANHLARAINTELAIHPDTLYRAANELRAATRALDRARWGREPSPVGTAARIRAAALIALALASLLIALMASVPLALGVAAACTVGGVMTYRTGRREVLTTVPALQAAEAVARRRWEQLAGVGADPAHVDAVVQRYDPDHRIVAELVGHNPAVRAAERAVAIHRAAWVRAWREEVGDTAEPSTTSVRTAVLERSPAPVSEAAVTPAATLVVAAPYAELSDERARQLHRRLLTLPAGPRVVVVLGPDSTADRLPVVDLTDPMVDLTAVADVTAVPEDAPTATQRTSF